MIAGSDVNGNFRWSYTSADQVWKTMEGFTVKFKHYTPDPEIEKGTAIEVEIHGFLYQNRTLYWISPGGAQQPYLSSLDSFSYLYRDGSLTVHWKKGAIEMEFRCQL